MLFWNLLGGFLLAASLTMTRVVSFQNPMQLVTRRSQLRHSKRFASKEEILIAALEQESEKLVAKIGKRPVPGDNPQERVRFVFSALTKGLLRRPNLAKALVRSLASGDPNITERVASFHALITALVMAAIRGEAPADEAVWGGNMDERERTIASILQNVWFSSFVGWAGGLHDGPQLLADVDKTAALLLAA